MISKIETPEKWKVKDASPVTLSDLENARVASIGVFGNSGELSSLVKKMEAMGCTPVSSFSLPAVVIRGEYSCGAELAAAIEGGAKVCHLIELIGLLENQHTENKFTDL